MDRKQLLDALSVVRPALATASLIPSLTHLMFRDGEILAFNDQIGISAPCGADFTGCVPGVTLLGVLSASKAKDVEFISGEDEVAIKAGGARVKLGVMPVGSFLFAMPTPPDGVRGVVVDESFIDGLRGCLRSVSPDTSVPDQLGVTIIPAKGKSSLFSINGISISSAAAEVGLRKRCVLPAAFCEQVVRLAAGDRKAKMYVDDIGALLTLSSGVRVFAKLVEVPRPLDFVAKFTEIVPGNFDEAAIEVPVALRLAVERALVVSDPGGERSYSSVTVKDGVLTLLTKSGRGEVRDRIKVAGHSDVSVLVDVQWIKTGLAAEFDQLLVTDDAVIMGKGEQRYLVATKSR